MMGAADLGRVGLSAGGSAFSRQIRAIFVIGPSLGLVSG